MGKQPKPEQTATKTAAVTNSLDKGFPESAAFGHLLLVRKQGEEDERLPFPEALHHPDRDVGDVKCDIPADLPREDEL